MKNRIFFASLKIEKLNFYRLFGVRYTVNERRRTQRSTGADEERALR